MSDRRAFLRSLASLPMIGGGVALIGQPVAAAVPVTPDLLHSYKSWLHMEHRMVSYEMAGHDLALSREIEGYHACGSQGARWHLQWAREGTRGPTGWIDARQPSTRAAVILSAAGCPLTGGRA